MGRMPILACVALAAIGSGAARAEAPPTPPPTDKAEPTDLSRPALDKLFERLASAKDPDEAAGIARLIERRWMRSGSDTADLLMNRALMSAGQDQALAIELLDRLIALEPGWAEAWNKRATLFYTMGDNERAVADIRQTLALEPRHYGAWSGLGMIFQSGDDDKHAVEAFRRALAIHPFLDKVKTLVERMAPGVDGRDL